MGNIISKIITLVMGVMAFFIMTTLVSNVKADLPANETGGAAFALLDIMPYILISVCILGLFAGGSYVVYVKYYKWKALGNRMKEAYSAKFGGPNTGFNEEVDQHIKMMEALGHGPTKDISEDWLKRMCKFVEIPYVVPEEEHVSEVKKTEGYE